MQICAWIKVQYQVTFLSLTCAIITVPRWVPLTTPALIHPSSLWHTRTDLSLFSQYTFYTDSGEFYVGGLQSHKYNQNRCLSDPGTGNTPALHACKEASNNNMNIYWDFKQVLFFSNQRDFLYRLYYLKHVCFIYTPCWSCLVFSAGWWSAQPKYTQMCRNTSSHTCYTELLRTAMGDEIYHQTLLMFISLPVQHGANT